MLKVIFLIMVVVTCSYGGIVYGESFRKRYLQLKEILKGVTILQNEVIYGSTPLPEALDSLKYKVDEPIQTVVDKVQKRLADGSAENVYEEFCREFQSHENEFYLNASDRKVMGDFLKSLGDCGVYGQEKIFQLALEGLKMNLKDADEISKRNTKLYKYLGVCFGIMIAIFFI